MFCGECGTQNPDTNSFCNNCGKPLRKTPAPSAAPVSYNIPPAGSEQRPPAGQPAASPVEVVPAVPEKKRRNWTGIISIILGLVSWAAYPYLLAIIAIVVGSYSIFHTRKATGKIPLTAIAGIVIALAAATADMFWLVLFPPTEGFAMTFWLIP